MKLICLTFIVLSSHLLLAQVNYGPRLTALGSSGVALHDHWSVSRNPAGLSYITDPVAAISYEQRFLDGDISDQSAVFIYPTSKYVFGLKFNRYGISAYNDQQVSLACSRKWDAVSIGIGFNYHQLKIQNYGSSGTVSVDIGFQYELNEDVVLGAHIANPAKSSYGPDVSESIPVLIAFGAAFRINDKLLFASDVQKSLKSAMSFRIGTEYTVAEWLALRGGISSHPLRQYFGFGINRGRFRFDTATYTQYYLGFVPQVGLSYEF